VPVVMWGSQKWTEEINVIPWLVCPRDHYERMALQERSKANRRYPKIDGLSSFDFEWFLKLYTDTDRTLLVGNTSPCTAIAKYPVRGKVTLNRIGDNDSRGLMCAEEDFVGRSAEHRQRK
jgi:hypothetical protein